MHQRRAGENQDACCVKECGPSLFINASYFFGVYLFFSVHDHHLLLCFCMHQALGMERSLWEKAICWRNAKDTTKCCSYAEKNNVPRKAAWLLGAVPVNGADDGADLVVKEK